MTEKPNTTTTIEISIETYNQLHSIRTSLAKILHKKTVSMDTTLQLFLTCQPLDVTLMDMILEENPSVSFDKRRKKNVSRHEKV
jgi:hypothetical protein